MTAADWATFAAAAAGIATTAVWLLYSGLRGQVRDNQTRIHLLETHGENRAEAGVQRAQLREELHSFRHEMRGSFETLRTETNDRLDRLSEQWLEIQLTRPRRRKIRK